MTSWTARDGRIAHGSGGGAEVAGRVAVAVTELGEVAVE